MKTLFLASLLALSSLTLNAADEGKSIPYTATVKGVVCGACKMHITHAFKKLPGVEQVSFAKGDEADTQKVTFNASSSDLSKDDAVEALGKDGKQYEIVSLNKD